MTARDPAGRRHGWRGPGGGFARSIWMAASDFTLRHVVIAGQDRDQRNRPLPHMAIERAPPPTSRKALGDEATASPELWPSRRQSRKPANIAPIEAAADIVRRTGESGSAGCRKFVRMLAEGSLSASERSSMTSRTPAPQTSRRVPQGSSSCLSTSPKGKGRDKCIRRRPIAISRHISMPI